LRSARDGRAQLADTGTDHASTRTLRITGRISRRAAIARAVAEAGAVGAEAGEEAGAEARAGVVASAGEGVQPGEFVRVSVGRGRREAMARAVSTASDSSSSWSSRVWSSMGLAPWVGMMAGR
jgi:hypothetical protein